MNKNSLKVVRYRMRVKQRLIDYKGGKCQTCGYSKPVPSAYHFHHVNPSEKAFGISGSTLGFERLKKEVDKCNLLCANCHAETHDKDWKIYRDKVFVLEKQPVKECDCQVCGVQFKPKRKKQIYCSRKCQHLSMKASKLPL